MAVNEQMERTETRNTTMRTEAVQSNPLEARKLTP